MKTLSVELIESATQKPDPDHSRSWINSITGKWFFEQLQITHQQALEEMSAIYMNEPEHDLRELYRLQGAAQNVWEIIKILESLKDE